MIVKVGIATFATYVLSSSNNILTADKAFVSLALFNLLRSPLNAFPNVITSVIEVIERFSFVTILSFSIQARVSNKRVQKFLNSEEIDENAVDRVLLGSDGYSVKIEDGSFRWSNRVDDSLVLKK